MLAYLLPFKHDLSCFPDDSTGFSSMPFSAPSTLMRNRYRSLFWLRGECFGDLGECFDADVFDGLFSSSRLWFYVTWESVVGLEVSVVLAVMVDVDSLISGFTVLLPSFEFVTSAIELP